MKKKVKIIVANPAGNITIFVKDRFEREMYPQVAEQLLAMDDIKGEQVAFILDTPSCGRAEGKMEMCGLEFCGNGSRSFGLIKAKEMGIKGKGSVFVDVSGCDEILTIEVDTDTDYTKVKMPNPVRVSKIDLSPLAIGDVIERDAAKAIGDAIEIGDATESPVMSEVPVVDFGGILHVILCGVPAAKENFEAIKDCIMAKFNPPALGVMFCEKNIEETRIETDADADATDMDVNTREIIQCPMVPVVYVKDVDTTYFEGSCGSGTTACAAAFGLRQGDGIHHFVFPQPAGTIEATAHISEGRIEKIFIEGKVELSPEIEVEIEI